MYLFQVPLELGTGVGRYQIVVDWPVYVRVDGWAKRFYENLTENPSLFTVQPVYPYDDALVQPP
jgi:hypothetical protein